MEPVAPERRSPVPPIAVPVAAAAAVRPSAGLDEQLGSRWAVWVGGVALALGGVFLVRYSIEQGLLGPGARTAFGALFAAVLVGAGEWLRRTERAPALPGLASAHVPSVLTAAGTSTAFATVYAAYALYGLIGPGGAFMLAAMLHGPALAALGFVAALASPLLVQTAKPNPWALVIYLVFTVFAAYSVARLRLWKWLAVSAAVGAIAWTVPLGFGREVAPAMAHLVLQTVLAGLFLVADPHRRTRDAEARLDPLAASVLGAFALMAVFVAGSHWAGTARPVVATVQAAVLLGLALRFAPAAAGAAAAAFVALGTMLLWPLASQALAEPRTVFPDLFGASPRPDAVETYLAFATLVPLAIAGASLWRLARGRELPLATAGWFAGAATVGPLLALVIAYWRVAALDRSISFAVAAGLLGLLFVLAAAWLRRQDGEALDGVRLGVGVTASAAVAALAAGLTFALDRGMLTVALALAALGTAWVGDAVRIPLLRNVVVAIGIVVAARLAWDPTIVRGDPGRLILNWILWGYGVPTAAFYIASRLIARHARDGAARFLESLAIVLAAFLVFFETRHALHAGDPFGDSSDHLEMGLFATEALAFALLMVRAERRRPDVVYRVASLAFGAASFAISALGLAFIENPLFTDEPVLGGPIFNSLLPAYLLPAGLAGWLAVAARRWRPRWYVLSAAAVALGLHLLYTQLEIRRLFQGPVIDVSLATSQGEQWSYSLALLAVGTALLAIGFVRDIRLARLASAAYVVAAVVKVFVVDLASLEGVMRALSFIGLGLVLVAIGLAYQRLLARRQALAPDPAT
jgi:uncharacterized membrane protein